MEFRILGPLEVVEQGRALPLGGARQRTLLALLLTRANEVVSADRLIDELWGAQPPTTAANALQYHVSQLRKALAPHEAIVTQEPGYVIRVGPDELDLLRFEALVEEARQAAPELAGQRLREALDLWRGPALADLADESFAQLRFRGSKSSAWGRSSGGSRPTLRSAATPSSSERSSRSSASTRSASGCGRAHASALRLRSPG